MASHRVAGLWCHRQRLGIAVQRSARPPARCGLMVPIVRCSLHAYARMDYGEFGPGIGRDTRKVLSSKMTYLRFSKSMT